MAVLEGPNGGLEGHAGADRARSGEGGLYCSLGRPFDSRDKQWPSLDAISGDRPMHTLGVWRRLVEVDG